MRFNVKWPASSARDGRGGKTKEGGVGAARVVGRSEIDEGWENGKADGTRGFANTKREPGDYDLPFVRSFQLFCPIKISIFSPPALSWLCLRVRSPFTVSSSSPYPSSASPPLAFYPMFADNPRSEAKANFSAPHAK